MQTVTVRKVPMLARDRTRTSVPVFLALAAAVLLATPARAATITLGIGSIATSAGPAGDVVTSTGIYQLVSLAPTGFNMDFLIPPVPIQLPLDGPAAFNSSATAATLAAAGFTPANGWMFSPAANDLPPNSLVITADQAGAGFPCPSNTAVSCSGIFAANTKGGGESNGFAVSNVNSVNNGHWIQTLSFTPNLAGQLLPLDNGGTPGMPNTSDPYYIDNTTAAKGESWAADKGNFLDAPLTSGNGVTCFLANLYYASGGTTAGTPNNKTQVTVYSGMAWGYCDINLNSANAAVFKAAVDSDLSSVASLDAAAGGGFDLTGDLTQTQISQIDSEFDADLAQTQIPEPSSLTLLGLGIASLVVRGFRARA